MEIIWYIIVSLMLVIYVLLDGFDFGVGIIYLFVAKNDAERSTVLSAIGPVWDGNEVWLIAGGGTLFFAFPAVYSAGFSGFYLALIMVLWLLMLRGLSMELRSHIKNSLWRTFWDSTLAFASVLMAIVLGAALGNVIRGVPLNGDGYFFVPFWTNFNTGVHPGILDWYTVTVGMFALALLTVHGANFLALKTEKEIQSRARQISKRLSWVVAFLAILSTFLTPFVRPDMLQNFNRFPLGYLLPVISLAALFGMFYYRARNHDAGAFIASSAFIVGLLTSAVFTIFPNLLVATTGAANSLTAYNASASHYGLSVGLIWFPVGMTLAATYTFYMYRSFWGKVTLSKDGEGY